MKATQAKSQPEYRSPDHYKHGYVWIGNTPYTPEQAVEKFGNKAHKILMQDSSIYCMNNSGPNK